MWWDYSIWFCQGFVLGYLIFAIIHRKSIKHVLAMQRQVTVQLNTINDTSDEVSRKLKAAREYYEEADKATMLLSHVSVLSEEAKQHPLGSAERVAVLGKIRELFLNYREGINPPEITS